MDFLKPKMDALTEERFNAPTKTIVFIHVYSAAGSSGIATKIITYKEADFIIARKVTFFNKQSEDVYKKKMAELDKLSYGQEFIIDDRDRYYSCFILVPQFEITNKEYTSK